MDPVFSALPDGGVSVHATTVAVGGVALALCGPSGSGKSGTAAQMMALGAELVADDLTILVQRNAAIEARAPDHGVAAMELRGLGVVPVALAPPTCLAAILVLEPSRGRLPEAETVDVLGDAVPLLRHPAQADLGAKLMIWLRGHGRHV